MFRAVTLLLPFTFAAATFPSSAENIVPSSTDSKAQASADKQNSSFQESFYSYTPEKPNTVSPLVLSFNQDHHLETVELLESNIRFDLDADGSKERTGWIKPGDGFLFVDLNRNGIVDDGKELFGEKSGFGTKAYNNGFEALEMFDTNNSGFVDTADQYFKLIRVWFDYNSNGISEKSEIRTLDDLQITHFEIQPTPYQSLEKVAENSKANEAGNSSLDKMDNYAPLSAKFWGPEMCGEAGCRSYNVFFLALH